MVTAIIVLIFDSGIFAFLDVLPTEYQHHVSYFVHCAGISDEHARYFEGTLMIGLCTVLRSLLKNLTQVTIASMLFSNYIPYWKAIEPACQDSEGGVPYSETVSSLAATAVFYLLLPLVVHTLLNTFVWGLAPAPIC